MLSNIQNNQNSIGINSDFGINFKKNEPLYAKKGEAIYQKDMDSDDDGVVTFDEFKDYCKQNNISKEKVNEMLKNWVALRSIQGIKKEDSENVVKEFIYSQKGDEKYDEKMDINSDNKVTYQEYMQYCREHARIQESKSNIQTYSNDIEIPKGMIDEEA